MNRRDALKLIAASSVAALAGPALASAQEGEGFFLGDLPLDSGVSHNGYSLLFARDGNCVFTSYDGCQVEHLYDLPGVRVWVEGEKIDFAYRGGKLHVLGSTNPDEPRRPRGGGHSQ